MRLMGRWSWIEQGRARQFHALRKDWAADVGANMGADPLTPSDTHTT
jgi:hypothetical protein